MFEGLIGSIIWFLANVLYVDQKRKGKGGWGRIVLFWMGMPLTWLWLFLVKEGSAPELQAVPDDADAILAEIRRDRRLNSGPSQNQEEKGPPPDRDGPLSF